MIIGIIRYQVYNPYLHHHTLLTRISILLQLYCSIILYRLGAGWSVHTNKMASFHKPGTLTADEHEQIMAVVRRAEMAEDTEQERIGSALVFTTNYSGISSFSLKSLSVTDLLFIRFILL